MILGTGIDLVEVGRIRDSLERLGDRFLQRVFLPGEISYCASHADPAPCYAARFAAKEAVSKAFGSGIGEAIGWKDIEITRLESGRPVVVLHGKGAKLLEERGAAAVLHLSLSHTASHATAMVILECAS